MKSKISTYLSVLVFIILSQAGKAQTDTIVAAYPAVNENKLVGSRWKYTYTTHAQSNTVIHRADKLYEYYLYLKFDGTLEHYLNGRYLKDTWKLNEGKNELYYNFRQVTWWKIAKLTDDQLILEFSNTKHSSYQYNFVRATEKETPFMRAANELPEVLVQSFQDDTPNRKAPKVKERRERRKKKKVVLKEEPVFIKIEMVGGGFYGGLDPVYSDITVINTDGRLIRETKTEKRGLVKVKKDIPRDKLEELAKYIDDKKFFDYPSYFNCTTTPCNRRLNSEPKPIPLRIVVTYGNKRKVVTVAIYGRNEHNLPYIDYPNDLELIIESIKRYAN